MDTCPQFWRMIEQERVATVVMLCVVQPGFTGCSQYFPQSDGEVMVHGDFTIRNMSTRTVSDGVILRKLELTGLSGNNIRI